MNENQHHERAIDKVIERVVHGKKASGNALLDAMAQTKPEADSAFRANLEERLMAEFSTNTSKKELAMLKRKEKPTKFGRWPLTMAAAVLAIMLVGGILLSVQQNGVDVVTHSDEAHPEYPFNLTATAIIATATAMANIGTEPIIMASHSAVSVETSQVRNEHIGILVGHQGISDIGAVCADGLSEVEINQAVAQMLQIKLQMRNYLVTILDEANPSASNLDLTILLHTSSCEAMNPSGYHLLLPEADYTDHLAACVTANYGRSTGLARLNDIPADVLSTIHTNPAILIEMGALSADRQLLTQETERIVQGLMDSIECYYVNETGSELYAGLSPVVIALEDIPINTIIRSEMLTLVYWPEDVAMQYALDNIGRWYTSRIEDLLGMQSRALIPALAPISSDSFSLPDGCSGATIATADCSHNLPAGYIGLIFYTTDLDSANFIAGQHVDIIASILVLDETNSTLSRLLTQRVISDAIVMRTEVLHPENEEEVFVMLALREQDGVVLQSLSDSGTPFILVPHLEGAEAVALPITQP